MTPRMQDAMQKVIAGDQPIENPYRVPQEATLAPQMPAPSPYSPKAKGLDADALDGLLKARMDEGISIGYYDGHEAASRNYGDVWDQGFFRGRQVGSEDAFRHHQADANSLLNTLHAETADLIEKINAALKLTRGETMRKQLLELHEAATAHASGMAARVAR